jgi:transcriptional regulator with XRE-family HTH domain
MDYSPKEMQDMGQRLRRMVKERGLSATQFAKQLGVVNDTVMKWFAGKNVGFLKRSKKICALLNISMRDLYGVDGDKMGELKKGEKDAEIAYWKGRAEALEQIIEKITAKDKIDH